MDQISIVVACPLHLAILKSDSHAPRNGLCPFCGGVWNDWEHYYPGDFDGRICLDNSPPEDTRKF